MKPTNKSKCRTCWCPKCGRGFMTIRVGGPNLKWYENLRNPFHPSFKGLPWWHIGFATEIALPGFALEDFGGKTATFKIKLSQFAILRRDFENEPGIQEQLWAIREGLA
jgi:hypothetical protein